MGSGEVRMPRDSAEALKNIAIVPRLLCFPLFGLKGDEVCIGKPISGFHKVYTLLPTNTSILYTVRLIFSIRACGYM